MIVLWILRCLPEVINRPSNDLDVASAGFLLPGMLLKFGPPLGQVLPPPLRRIIKRPASEPKAKVLECFFFS